MTKRSFPDVNVWFALAVADHPQHPPALAWWNEESSLAGFSRLTQLGLLRLLTTAAAMGGQPLSNDAAWRVYDGFLSDSRVRLFPELPALEDLFRSYSDLRQAAPKLLGRRVSGGARGGERGGPGHLRPGLHALRGRMPYPDLNRNRKNASTEHRVPAGRGSLFCRCGARAVCPGPV